MVLKMQDAEENLLDLVRDKLLIGLKINNEHF